MRDTTAIFAGRIDSVSDARHFVVTALDGWGLSGHAPELGVLVTELSTNCVIHARTDFTVTVSLTGEALRLDVRDGSRRAPSVKTRSADAMTGRGLHLVAAYADRWGFTPTAAGKTVWCEVALTPGRSGRSARTGADRSSRPAAGQADGQAGSTGRERRGADVRGRLVGAA